MLLKFHGQLFFLLLLFFFFRKKTRKFERKLIYVFTEYVKIKREPERKRETWRRISREQRETERLRARGNKSSYVGIKLGVPECLYNYWVTDREKREVKQEVLLAKGALTLVNVCKG